MRETISSGLVRRHSSVVISAKVTATDSTRNGRADRSAPSSTTVGTTTAISTRSRHA